MARAILSCLTLGVAAAALTASGNPMLAVAAGTAAGGMAGNLGTDLFKALDRRAAERFLQGWSGIDENHHVAEALRLAQIKALRAVLKRFDDTRKTDIDPFRKDREDRFSAALSGFLSDETRLAQRAFSRDAAAPDEQAVRAAVLSRLPDAFDQSLAARRAGGERQAIAESVAHIRGAVEAAVLAEVRMRTVPAEGTLPPLFEAAFMGKGFPDAWFDLFIRDAAARLKDDDAFYRIWGAEQGALTKAIVAAYDTALGRIDARTERIETRQASDSAKIDEMLALLRASGTVAKAEAQGISEAAVRAIVERLGGEGIVRDDLVPWLDTWIEEARGALGRTNNEGEAFEAARREAERRFRAGRLGDASTPFMEEIAREEHAELERQEERRRRRIRLLEEAVRFDELALATDAAVQKLRMIAEAEGKAGFDSSAAWLLGRAEEFYTRGRDRGQNGAVLLSIAIHRAVLEEWTRERVPLQWVAVQNNLGNALLALGERESRTARLQEAVDAYRAALEELQRERVPLDWAATQNNLGNALQRLGERERGTARLEEAIGAYRAALEKRTRERVPIDWAATQHNLGNALMRLGERETGTVRLKEAVAAHRAALEELTRDREPLQWAATEHTLVSVLQMLGSREGGKTRLEEAVAAYRAALEEGTRERVPLDWAATQSDLGAALRTLGERESGTVRLKEAVAAYRAALEEQTRERTPFQWAATQHNLGNALRRLGERESGTARLEDAVAAYRAALEEWTREQVPLDWAMVQNNLGNVLRSLGERESSMVRLEAAAEAYRASLKERTREEVPLDWAATQNNLGLVLQTLGSREDNTALLEEAVAACQASLEERTRERVPLDWAATQNNLGLALHALGERESGTARLEAAIACYWATLEEETRERVPLNWAMTQNNLGNVLWTIGERESGTARLEEAVAAYQAALEVLTPEDAVHYHSITAASLRSVLAEIARREAAAPTSADT